MQTSTAKKEGKAITQVKIESLSWEWEAGEMSSLMWEPHHYSKHQRNRRHCLNCHKKPASQFVTHIAKETWHLCARCVNKSIKHALKAKRAVFVFLEGEADWQEVKTVGEWETFSHSPPSREEDN